ncbi:MAG: hypothetical protein ACPGN3_15155 [Opitutales bacterium]
MKSLALAALLTFTTSMFGVSVDAFISDTQRMKSEAQSMKLVWWVPLEYWKVSLSSNPSISEAQKEEMYALLEDYQALIVVDATIGIMGGFTPVSRKLIEESLVFKIGETPIKQIEGSDLPSDVNNLFNVILKPVFTQMLGQMGAGMEIFVYPAKNNSKLLADPFSEGAISVSLTGDDFEWKLPLPSLLPPKIDPESGDVFPGDFIFNPYTGKKLEVQSEE